MKIKALVPFSTGTISMEQYEVKEVTETIGEQLVAAGVAVEIGGGSGGVLVVHDVEGTLDKTWQEIHDAFPMVRAESNEGTYFSVASVLREDESYNVHSWDGEAKTRYVSDSADGYPTTD